MLALLKRSLTEFGSDDAPLLAAGLAYFSLFSIAPLLVISIAIAGLFFGEEATQGRVEETIGSLVGAQSAQAIAEMIRGAAQKKEQGVVGLAGGIAALLLGASGVFAHLRNVLDKIWGVDVPKRRGIRATIVDKLWSIGFVLSVGFILVVSLLVSTALAATGAWMETRLPLAPWVWHAVNFAISFVVLTLVFAAMYKVIPDAEIEWRDVWGGAAFTSLLFGIGKLAIGFYLGRSAFASVYGAAGSILIVLLWLYYSGLIVLYGAEFTEVWARERSGQETREQRRGR
ncbi:MAG TPA: YihY/virulence factor BrkB family protein [Thermoanaerobaculia bacterium]